MKKSSILIVDDRPIELEYLNTVLAYGGYELTEARDGAKALEIARMLRPDLVITDIMMPTMDGYELARELRAEPSLAQTKLIFYSATTRCDDAVVLAESLGAARFATKPMEPEDILRLVATTLQEPPLPGTETSQIDVERLHLRLLSESLAQKTDELEAEIRVRLQAESLLRRSQARTLAILNSSLDAIVSMDSEGAIVEFNPTAERMFGHAKTMAMGANFVEFLFPPPARDEVRGFLRDGKISTRDRRSLNRGIGTLAWRSDGSEFPVEVLVSRAEIEGETIITAQIQDITEHKKLEEQLLRAQRLESIGTLASGVAHDLNNILTPILMSVTLLYEDLPEDQRRLIVSTIESCAQRGADIVKQVLTFARGAQGERVPVQPLWLMRDMAKIAQETFPKNIAITQLHSGRLWNVKGDSTQLHQVLLNLCVNARDAMPHGGSLTLEAENFTADEHYTATMLEAEPGDYVILRVKDTGTGIPPEVAERIFDPFFTTKEVTQGTGLGLSTAMGIVKSHGGFFNLKTVVGRGTEFEVYLPASREAEAERPAEVQPVPKGEGETILVVDDEAAICTVTGTTLQSNGYKVLSAADGAEAIGIFAVRRNEISVVLTDLAMPYFDGVALTRALRKLDPNVRVVASSDENLETRRRELEDLGVRDFLRKPCTSDSLLRTIHAALHPPVS